MGIFDIIGDRIAPGLQKAMDLRYDRTKAIASNVANVETPGYRAMELDFASELERAFDGKGSNDIQVTNSKHMNVSSQGLAHLTPDYSGATKADGNNVDLDLQMGKLSHNGGQYELAMEFLKKKMRMVKLAIRSAQG